MDDYPPIFELDEVATIVGMPKSLAKNWTIGRPLKITASVRTARGKGSRNLFSLGDVFKMALAYEMSEAGLSAKLIQLVLEQLEAIVGSYLNEALNNSAVNDDSWLVIGSRGDDVDLELCSKEVKLRRDDDAGVFVYHAIDLVSILTQVFNRIELLHPTIERKSPQIGKQRKGQRRK